MRTNCRIIPSLLLLITLTLPALVYALPNQSLMICIKQDSAANYQNTDMNGSWASSAIGVTNFASLTATPEGHTYWGGADIDNTRTPKLMAGYNNFSSLTGTTVVDNFNADLAINGDGSIVFTTDRANKINDLIGFLSKNRQYMLGVDGIVWTGTTSDDIQLKMDFAIKRSVGKTNADLNGVYHIRSLELFETSNGNRMAALDWGTLTFSGATYTYSLNAYLSDGTTTLSPVTGSGTYIVQNRGDITFLEPPAPDTFGQLSDDGNAIYAVLGAVSSIGTNHNSLGVSIKESNRTFSNADLNGEYFAVLLGVDHIHDNGRTAALVWGIFSFDGIGNFTMAEINQLHADDSTGTKDQLFNNNGSYTVSTGGVVKITFDTINGQPDTGMFEGHLSEDNEIMALSSISNSTVGTGSSTSPSSSGGGGGGGGCFIGTMHMDTAHINSPR